MLLVAFALAVPGSAVAAGEATSPYSQKPAEPTTGTSPSTEKSTPEKTTPAGKEEPAKTTSTTTPSTSTGAEKATTLPFTGLDLRWTVAFGLLLVGAGFSIVVVQRRQRGSR
jgi:uncharacterized surface anchored protein